MRPTPSGTRREPIKVGALYVFVYHVGDSLVLPPLTLLGPQKPKKKDIKKQLSRFGLVWGGCSLADQPQSPMKDSWQKEAVMSATTL